MQNQGNNSYENALLNCRKSIDAIDDKILKLLQERIAIVKEVKEIKDKNGEDFFIKSAREADMINSLISRSQDVKSEVVSSIWRKIITSSNVLEQPIKISLYNPLGLADYQYLIRQYYADFVPISSHKSIENVILDLENDRAQIAVFPLPTQENDNVENWWMNLANSKNGLKVFAKIPFNYSDNEINLVALAKKNQEKSQHDTTLICAEIDEKFGKSQIISDFKKLGFEAKIFKSVRLKAVNGVVFYLMEIDGYFEEDGFLELKKSELKPHVKVLGVCPVV